MVNPAPSASISDLNNIISMDFMISHSFKNFIAAELESVKNSRFGKKFLKSPL